MAGGCEEMNQSLIINSNMLINICLSDECTFYLHGAVSRYNCCYWSDLNPHSFWEVHSQHPQKLNVWAGMLGVNIVGPLFIAGNLMSEVYLDTLEITIM